jgi:hypothetical protein
MPASKQLGSVCNKWDGKLKKCVAKTDVMQVEGTNAAYFLCKLAVDADGAPRAYHPRDVNPNSNSGKAFDWLANLSKSDRHGIQGEDGEGPADGFVVSGTTAQNKSVDNTKNTARYVDASTIPYVVLPGAKFPLPNGAKLKDGCVAFVVDTQTGGTSGAIFADIGRAVGEGSIALARRLGLFPFSKKLFPKVIGFEDKKDFSRFFCVVFPEAIIPPPWPVADIQKAADARFKAWGGEAQLKSIVAGLPPLKPPDESPLPPLPDPAA